jgi:hypothetical protein
MLHRSKIGVAAMFYDPNAVKAMQGWSRLASSWTRMSMTAGEVIMRRSMMLAQGAMSGPEMTRMMLEKPSALAAAAEKAVTAAARGGDPVKVAAAALRPIGARTRANAKRLRR